MCVCQLAVSPPFFGVRFLFLQLVLVECLISRCPFFVGIHGLVVCGTRTVDGRLLVAMLWSMSLPTFQDGKRDAKWFCFSRKKHRFFIDIDPFFSSPQCQPPYSSVDRRLLRHDAFWSRKCFPSGSILMDSFPVFLSLIFFDLCFFFSFSRLAHWEMF